MEALLAIAAFTLFGVGCYLLGRCGL